MGLLVSSFTYLLAYWFVSLVAFEFSYFRERLISKIGKA